MKQWLATAVMSAGLVMGAWGQPQTPLHAKVSVNWASPGLPVAEALQDLAAKASVEFAFDNSQVEHLPPVILKMDEVAAGRIAMRVLRPHGLTLENVDGSRPRIVRDDPYREFKPQREAVFTFARPPTLTRDGDDVTIAFETRGWCDVTVAIEHEDGRMLRHLASGVLGLHAPEPFVWNAKAQTIVWDGKDDAGVYVDNKDAVTVRVSLGLKPRFERTLFWHPGKMAGGTVAMAAAPEGVYVFSGRGFDHVRLFDRDGNYVRTVYPFPSDKLSGIPDLKWHELPDGHRVPIKPNYYQSTFLKSGHNATNLRYRDGRYQGGGDSGTFYGAAGNALAVSGDRLALIGHRVSRFGTAGGEIENVNLHGPEVVLPLRSPWTGHRLATPGENSPLRTQSRPKRAAISPDGRTLYLTAYHEGPVGARNQVYWHQQHRVMRMPLSGDATPTVFAETADGGDGPGAFNMPADVACDSQGRVYVADHLNDRIQVFDAEGGFLKSVATERPARITVHHETSEIYVFSWGLALHVQRSSRSGRPGHVNSELSAYNRFQLTRFSSLDDGAEEQASWDLQAVTGWRDTSSNLEHDAVVDTGSDPVRVWAYAPSPVGARNPAGRGFVVLAQENDDWTVKRDLRDEAARAITDLNPPAYFRQRLFVNPAEDGIVYLAEPGGGTDVGMGFKRLLRIDVQTGRSRRVELPMTVEDMAFSPDGFAYLKLRDMIVRYDPQTWREVPFDYGEERRRATFGVHGGSRAAQVISGAVFPGGGRHHGGLHVSAAGDIAVSAVYGVGPEERTAQAKVHDGARYETRLYPGRRFGGHGVMQVHVLDRHGRLQRVDAVPGLSQNAYGTGIDARGDIYVLEAPARRINGELYFNDLTGTVMKFTPGAARMLAPSGTPIPLTVTPARPRELQSAWVEGAHWFYGGVGWSGFNAPDGSQCHCPNPRFAVDYFARSFTPEHHRFNVGVVDANGNLILRVGQYGNVDDGMPLGHEDQAAGARAIGSPPNPRSIGGDEVALFSPRAVAIDTDRRLYISDLGNARIASVKLGYHTEERLGLKAVPDKGAERP